ncbi:MAG: hypothetical protein AAFO72_10465, partial [Pseudomonadota bacterium]
MLYSHPFFFVACLGLAVLAPMQAGAQNKELAAENYRQADTDGDGRLIFAEFTDFIDLNAADGLGNAARVKSRGLHARAFERVDANGDGVVTLEE